MTKAAYHIAIVVLVLVFNTPVAADPWLAPGDEMLRADIQRLADAGILRGPVTTWPISWPDVARDVMAARGTDHDPEVGHALLRVQRRARAAASHGFSGLGFEVAGSTQPTSFRRFANAPREEGEVSVNAGWLTDHVVVNFRGTYAADPEDGKTLRPDGSHLGINVGNFMISVGYMERWWGPGWDGSLILSTNARPIPSLTLERNYSDPFRSPWLSWLGPWRASIAVGEAESHDVPIANVRFMAARVNFKPRPWLEFGLSRTAQWCGGNRPCSWNTFKNMLIGRDNEPDDGLMQPGNQMAGYDFRLRSPWKQVPMALYSQWIGEDEAGGLPSKFLGLVGVELWGSSPWGNWTGRAEFADSACSFTRERPEFECGYRNSIYPQGYSYRGRIIGHSMDNDSSMYTLAGLLTRPDGKSLSLAVRRVEVNRDGGPHSISTMPLDVDNVELRYSRGLWAGTISVGITYENPPLANASSRIQGFAVWRQGF